MQQYSYKPEPQAEYTIHGGWVLTLARLLESKGLSPDQLLHEAGLPGRADILPSDRLPFKGNKRLWELAIENTHDPYLGLAMPEFFCNATFHALGIAMESSGSLLEALNRYVRYGNVLGNAGDKQLLETDEGYCVCLAAYRDADNNPFDHYSSLDGLFAVVVSICRDLLTSDFHPMRVELIRPEPEDTTVFENFFAAPVVFGASDYKIIIDRETMLAPIYGGDTELATQIDTFLGVRFADNLQSDILKQVRQHIIALLPEGAPAKEDVARKLNVSERTLQRKLGQQNYSFRELIAETRKELACHHLHDRRITINEVAFLLGYSEETNFTRAFKRWTGLTPTDYRNKLGSETE